MGWGPSTALSSSPRITTSLLKPPPCSGYCAGRHIKPSCCSMCGCAILEKLDNLCNFCRVKESIHIASRDDYSSQNQHEWKTSQKRSRGRNLRWPPHVKPVLFWGFSNCCHCSAPVVTSMNTNTAESGQRCPQLLNQPENYPTSLTDFMPGPVKKVFL